MTSYSHILAALDDSPQSKAVLERAARLASTFGARLSLLNAVERMPADIPVDIVPPEAVDKFDWLEEGARDSLKAMAQELAVEPAEIAVVAGSPRHGIIDFARDKAVDLIVVGSHERHGIALLWGSTTDSVVHNAPCDVLAVHTERQRHD